MSSTSIIDQLRQDGFRITQMRRALIQIFSDASTPLSVADLNDALVAQNLRVNKTTIYREVDFLSERELIKTVQFNEDQKRYELSSDHHHHLVCESCKNVEKVELKSLEPLLDQAEQELRQRLGFSLVDHSLEFFGRCNACAA